MTVLLVALRTVIDNIIRSLPSIVFVLILAGAFALHECDGNQDKYEHGIGL